MALIGTRFVLQGFRITCTVNKFSFSTSNLRNNKWRKEQGLEPNPTAFGPLINLPDFSFVDGRPIPLSARKFEKLKLQRKYCEQIVELSREIDLDLQNYNERQQDIKKEREDIINNKLKAKGAELLKNKSKSS